MNFGVCNLHSSPEYVELSNYGQANFQMSQDCVDLLSQFGNKIWNFVAKGLKVTGLLHTLNSYFYPDTFKAAANEFNLQFNERLNNQFKTNLSAVSTVADVDNNKKLTVNLYNRAETISILNRLEKDARDEGDPCNALPELTLLMGMLNEKKDTNLNIREKAKISLSFDQLAVNYESALAANKLSMRQQWVAQQIFDLKFKFFYQFGESEHEIITKLQMAPALKAKWKLGALRQTVHKGFVEVSTPGSQLGASIGGRATLAYEKLDVIDQEQYYNSYRLFYGGLSFEEEFKLGGEIEGIAAAKTVQNFSAGIQGFGGTFREPKTPLDAANRDFKTLVKEGDYTLSRARLLNQATAIHLDKELVAELNELDDLEQRRLEYRQKKEGMDKRQSLYMSKSPTSKELIEYQSTSHKQSRDLQLEAWTNPSDEPKFAATPVKLASDEVTEASVLGFVGKLSASATSKVSFGKEKFGDDNVTGSLGGGALSSATFTGEGMVRNRYEVKRTPLITRYLDHTKSVYEKEDLRFFTDTGYQEIASALTEFEKEKERNESYASSSLTELGLDLLSWVRSTEAPDRKYFKTDSEYQQAVKKSQANLRELPAFFDENGHDKSWLELLNTPKAERINYLIDLNDTRLTKARTTPNFNIETLKDVNDLLKYLQRNLKKYSELQAGKVGVEFKSHEHKQYVLRKFEHSCGANNPEEFVHRYYIAGLYLLTKAPELVAQEKESEESKESMLDEISDAIYQFGSSLQPSALPFAVNADYLIERLNFNEDLCISLKQVQIEVETKAGAYLSLKGADVDTDLRFQTEFSAYGKFAVKATYTHLGGHRNQLRLGHGLQLSVTVGVGVSVDAAVADIAPELNDKISDTAFADYAIDQLRARAKMELSASYIKEVTFDMYISRPDKLSKYSEEFEPAIYFFRKSKTRIIDATDKQTFACGPVDLKFGGGTINVETDPQVEICGSNTPMQFFIRYMHEKDCNGIDKINGSIDEESEWNIVKQDPESIKEFLINFANEKDYSMQSVQRPKGAISHYLFEFEKAVNNNPNYLKQLLFMFETARREGNTTLNDKITALRKAIREHKTSNELDGVLSEYNFMKTRKKLKEVAITLKNLQSNGSIDDKKRAYNQGLECFENLMHAYYPQALERKSNTPSLKPRKPFLWDNTKGILAAQLQKARMSLGGLVQHTRT